MKILVTGVGGFAGGYIARHLFKIGYDVAGTWRNNKPKVEYELFRVELSSKINISIKPDVIVHAAGALPYRGCGYADYVRDNIDSMRNLLEFAVKKDTKRLINLSTIGVYGEFLSEVINEDSDRINPDAYGATKYIAECLLKESGIDGISLRMPGIIGPNAKGVWLTNIKERMENNESVIIYTPDFITKNFVWIDDLANFMSDLIESSVWKHNALVLACKEGASIKDIISEMVKKTNSSSSIIVNNEMRRPFCLDATRAFEMGYNPMSVMEIVKNA